jgi:hypothetical protein
VLPYVQELEYWEYYEKRPQLNALPVTDVEQVAALAWVNLSAEIGEPVVIAASTAWLYNEAMRADRMIISELTEVRYRGHDDQGLTLERRSTISGSVPTGVSIRGVADCFEDVSNRALAFVVGARRRALQQCSDAWRGWTPSWSAWEPVRLPRTAAYNIALTGTVRLPLKLEVVTSTSELSAFIVPPK